MVWTHAPMSVSTPPGSTVLTVIARAPAPPPACDPGARGRPRHLGPFVHNHGQIGAAVAVVVARRFRLATQQTPRALAHVRRSYSYGVVQRSHRTCPPQPQIHCDSPPRRIAASA